MDTHAMLRTLVQRVGPGVLADAEELRSVLDDFASDADLALGQQNLLVDAVRLGGYELLDRLISAGAEPAAAVAAAGDRLAQERGSTDATGARWACAALGFAADLVPEDLVRHYADLRGGSGSPAAGTGPGAARTPHKPVDRDAPEPAATSPEQATTSPTPPLDARAAEQQPPTTRPREQREESTRAQPQQLPHPAQGPSGAQGRRRTLVIASAGLLLVVAAFVAVALWTDLIPGGDDGGGSGGDEPVQEPFESADLFAMARPYFDPGNCTVPTTQAEAPVAWPLDWRELVKCERDDYSGTFLCTDNDAQLAEARAAFLDKAIDEPRSLDGHPADQPAAPFQVAFHHEGVGTRAYWDSPAQLCLAELQSTSDELDDVVRIWREGMPR